jgi:hypothetical protein
MRVNIVAPGPADTDSAVCPVPLSPNSGTCVLPITIASAALIRSTAASSSPGMKSAQPYEPEAVRTSLVQIRSLTRPTAGHTADCVN